MQMRRWTGRLALAAAGVLATFAALDAFMRTRVGECGLTPFATSTVQGLPHLLFPGRTTIYKGVPVRINADGFRGADFVPPPPGQPRVALIGDSVTFGNGCPEEGTLAAAVASQLAAQGRPAQVLDCGIPAYNADNVAVLLRERVLALHPDRVVYVMVANDVCDSHRRTEIPVDATIDACADFPLGSPLLQMVNQNMSGLLRRCGLQLDGYVESVLKQNTRTGGERLRRALTSMQEQCAAAGVGFGVAIYPFMTRLDMNPFRPIEESCATLCAELGIPCVALAGAFRSDENLVRHWVGPLDAHPDAAANARVAPLLVEKLLPR